MDVIHSQFEEMMKAILQMQPKRAASSETSQKGFDAGNQTTISLLDDLQTIHRKFLDTLLQDCFLAGKTATTKFGDEANCEEDAIGTVVAEVLTLCNDMCDTWETYEGNQQGVTSETVDSVATQLSHEFERRTSFLFQVFSNLSTYSVVNGGRVRGSSLGLWLIRLDFNQYFSRHVEGLKQHGLGIDNNLPSLPN